MFYAKDRTRPNDQSAGELTMSQPNNQTSGDRENEHPTNHVTVAEAARLLGASAEAVRMRVKRGSLESTKINGTVYVILDSELTRPNQDPTDGDNGPVRSSYGDPTAEQTDELTDDRIGLGESLRSEVEFLREELRSREEIRAEENRRKDTIIAQLTQRIPELEPTPERKESSDTPSDSAEPRSATEGTQEPEKRRSWLVRFFFGPS